MGVLNCRFRDFLGRKIWQVFFGWLDLSRILGAIQSNLKIPGSAPSYPGRVVLRIKYRHGIFLGGFAGTCITFSFLYTSSLQDYKVKVPNFTFRRGREYKTTTLFFFLNFDTVF